jgi:hypothetical protein
MPMGPTPNFAIVNGDGTPTSYFFRYLLDFRIAALTTLDLEILEALADKSDVDPEEEADFDESGSDQPQADELAALALADTAAAPFDPSELQLAALLSDNSQAASDPSELQLAILLADRGDAAPGFPVTRDLIANIPTFVNAGDDGRLFYATDYSHVYRWNAAGPGWIFIEGDASGYVVIGQPSGVPNGGLWGLCNGSTYAVAQSDGTVANVTTATIAGAYIRR